MAYQIKSLFALLNNNVTFVNHYVCAKSYSKFYVLIFFYPDTNFKR